ncbi:MAG: YbaK/EbsC family protein, partial [Limosilactobacillus mucosae]
QYWGVCPQAIDFSRWWLTEFQELTGTRRISMAHDSDIEDQLGLEAGIVSPFGIMNNAAHNIQIYFDQDMLDENIPLTFHPNINTHTIFLSASGRSDEIHQSSRIRLSNY